MRQDSVQENTGVALKEVSDAINISALNPEMDLERFLDEDYLKPEVSEDIPATSKGCSDKRGSTGHAWQKN